MMMNNKINIEFMTDEALETLKSNSLTANNYLKTEKNNSEWLKEIYNGKLYEPMKQKINDFELKISLNDNYDEVDFDNSIILYESLKELPLYILTNERFWAWINFEKGYKAAIQAMPIKSNSTFSDHWLFTQGSRRGIFFGVLSRCYFRVALTVDERLDDKYELTRFVIENPERFRNLTWRSSSSEKHIVLGVIKAEKDIYDKYGNKVKNSIYKDIAKEISLYASVRLIDIVSEEDIYKFVYNKMEQMINEQTSDYLNNIDYKEINEEKIDELVAV